jgi:hypothetical protein
MYNLSWHLLVPILKKKYKIICDLYKNDKIGKW